MPKKAGFVEAISFFLGALVGHMIKTYIAIMLLYWFGWLPW